MELKVLHDRTFLLWSIFPPPVFLSLFLGSEATTQPQDTETDMQHQSAEESNQPQNTRAATQVQGTCIGAQPQGVQEKFY